jgi:hypothetical protein
MRNSQICIEAVSLEPCNLTGGNLLPSAGAIHSFYLMYAGLRCHHTLQGAFH